MSAVDFVAGTAGRWAASGLNVLAGPRLSVLIFHRVLAHSDAMFPGEPDAVRFERLMGLVARSFQVLTLADAAQRLVANTLPARALAITFDDGYADNHDVALPILQRHGLVATFYVSTGFLNGGRMWNDSIIETIRRCASPQLDLAIFGQGVVPLADDVQRRAAIDALLPVLKHKLPQARDEAVSQVWALAGKPALPDTLMMRNQQVQALHSAGMEIGAHTVNHPILAAIDDGAAMTEISSGRNTLQALIQAPVTTLAYPNGRPGRDYHQRHAEMARSLGFAAAVTTAPGVSRPGDDVFQLPRFTPWDRSPARWLARLVATNGQGALAPCAPVPDVQTRAQALT